VFALTARHRVQLCIRRYGFLCEKIARTMGAAARASGHVAAPHAVATAVVSPAAAFQPLVYRGRAAEAHFAAHVPTCTRLLVTNPANHQPSSLLGQ
jgi:hypothetical protein